MQHPAEILQKAADLIESVGHCKGSYQGLGWDEEEFREIVTGYCLFGSLYRAAGLSEADDVRKFPPQLHRAIELVKPITTRPEKYNMELIEWNDADEREPAEVIDLLRHAAKAIHNGEVPE